MPEQTTKVAIGGKISLWKQSTMNPDREQSEWVHIVCNISYLRTKAYETADDKSCDLLEDFNMEATNYEP